MRRLFALLTILTILITSSGCKSSSLSDVAMAATAMVEGDTLQGIPTEANLKVAFVGDTGYGTNFQTVLNLIANENVDLVLHQGDFTYSTSSTNINTFFTKINDTLSPPPPPGQSVRANFPYFASDGNHDNWQTFANHTKGFYQRLIDNSPAATLVDWQVVNSKRCERYHISFKGLSIVFIGSDDSDDGTNDGCTTTTPTDQSALAGAAYINSQFQNDRHIWKVVSWHKNQERMQIGGKSDEMNWDVYNNARLHGAIIATGHEHSYERTKTLSGMPPTGFIIDPICNGRFDLCVSLGRTFAFVSGVAGQTIRDQETCCDAGNGDCIEQTPPPAQDVGDDGVYPYGTCNEWALVYTTDQLNTPNQVNSGQTLTDIRHGVLFIEFNINNDPRKAHGYFKTIPYSDPGEPSPTSKIIDDFTIDNSAYYPMVKKPRP